MVAIIGGFKARFSGPVILPLPGKQKPHQLSPKGFEGLCV
jgi:hypothetical protein